MVRKLLEALMGNLGVELDDSKMDAFIGKKMVNMNFYPTCPNPELTVGVGRHSDMSTLTILLQDGIGGLYVRVPEDVDMEKKGEWIEIPPIPGAIVINVGTKVQSIECELHAQNLECQQQYS
ncbi:scopoletin 8-hydroxylase-like [Hibiscus syriacus]|uniref:scopoletin 8-hydroxylase-like n=1 Tax=Hibiscus syriacus TaxID=106335 RepID=UPI00192261F0|nr:scopoletin 8-hydroxylase-like [Hibiscus syriacus]